MTKSIAPNWNEVSALEHTLGAEIEEDAIETWTPRNARTWAHGGFLGHGLSWEGSDMSSTDTVNWTAIPGATHVIHPHTEDALGVFEFDVHVYGQSFEVRVTKINLTTSAVTQTTFSQPLGSYAAAQQTITLSDDPYVVRYDFRQNGPATGVLLALIPRETIKTSDVP